MVMGRVLTGLQLGTEGTASSFGTCQANRQESVGQADCDSDVTLGVSVFYVNSHRNGCWCQAHNNLTDERCWILQFLGAPCQKYYLLN